MTHRIFKEVPPRNAELDRLLEEARNAPPMTPEQREEQRRSFAYGNCAIENPDVTREVVDKAAEKLNRERAHRTLLSDILGHHIGPVHPDIMPYTPVEKESAK